nr:MAG TPA: hypothetical protein [Caudoviricetes sp.]
MSSWSHSFKSKHYFSLVRVARGFSSSYSYFFLFILASLVLRFVEWEGICLLSIIFNQNLQGVFVC